jgi:hypothetical protein
LPPTPGSPSCGNTSDPRRPVAGATMIRNLTMPAFPTMITVCGQRVMDGVDFPITVGDDVTGAAAEAEVRGDVVLLACPSCGDIFSAPPDVAGALIDCVSCPWQGSAGTPQH